MGDIKISVNGVELTVQKDEFSKAIESGNLSVKNEDLVIKTKEQHSQFMANIDLEKKSKYDEGTEVGEKRAVKAISEKYKVPLEDQKKTVENFATVFKQKIIADAKIEPNKKIEELQADNEKLRGNYNKLETDFNSFKTKTTEKETKSRIVSKVDEAVPQTDTLIPSKDIGILFRRKHEVSFDEDGREVVKKDGQVLKDPKTLNPLSIKDIMTDFAVPYIKKPEGGRGNGDETPPNTGSYDAFVKEMEDKNIQQGSEVFQIELQKRIREGTLKM